MKISRLSVFSLLQLICVFAWTNFAQAAIVHDIPSLTSITFYETTSNITAYTFGLSSSQLTTQLASLGSGSYDFYGVAGHEYYDVFYSNADGSLNTNGEYITVEAVYDFGLPSGGGLNIAEIGLNFSNGTSVFANSVVSFMALGNNAIPEDVGNAVDGNLSTYTTMGNTLGQSDRLRITVNPVPIPGAFILLCSCLAGLGVIRSQRRYRPL